MSSLLRNAILASIVFSPAIAGASGWSVTPQAALQHDVTHYSVDGDSGNENAARRTRFGLKAVHEAGVELHLEWDVASGSATDLYLDWNIDKNRQLRFGQYKQPFSLEELGSSKDVLLLERSLAHDAFTIGRRVGLMWSQPAGSLNLEASGFAGVAEQVSGSSGAALRLYSSNNPNLHLGAALAYEQRDDERLRQRARSETRLLPFNPLDTGSRRGVGSAVKAGLEAAWINGPWAVQSEAFLQQGNGGDDPSGIGATVQASWLSNGASRSIKKGVVKKADVSEISTLWEFAGRVSHVDFDIDSGLIGSQTQVGIGASLYVGSHWKFMAEQSYFDATRSVRISNPGDFTGHFTSFRAQVVF